MGPHERCALRRDYSNPQISEVGMRFDAGAVWFVDIIFLRSLQNFNS
jgi:hypothetical protein